MSQKPYTSTAGPPRTAVHAFKSLRKFRNQRATGSCRIRIDNFLRADSLNTDPALRGQQHEIRYGVFRVYRSRPARFCGCRRSARHLRRQWSSRVYSRQRGERSPSRPGANQHPQRFNPSKLHFAFDAKDPRSSKWRLLSADWQMIRLSFLELLVTAGLLTATPASAQTGISQYPFCIQGVDNPGWSGCSFQTLPECQAASGTEAECLAHPW